MFRDLSVCCRPRLVRCNLRLPLAALFVLTAAGDLRLSGHQRWVDRSPGGVLFAQQPVAKSSEMLPTDSGQEPRIEPRIEPGDFSATEFLSSDGAIRFETDFAGGKIDRFREINDRKFDLLVRPESQPINDSAWYAFKVSASEPTKILVELRYEGGSHRYEPKISRDKIQWTAADDRIVRRHPAGRQVVIELDVDEDPLWVAGQELQSNKDVGQWVDALAAGKRITATTLTKSVEGRPIHRLAIGNPDAKNVVYVISRQHPPEVTGTIGMMTFVESLTGQTSLAKRFRSEFLTIVIPVANPDGVAKGYWRTNANAVDLNRDWLRFTQPETRAMRDDLIALRDRDGRKLWLFLDFHSTYNEVFYTVPKTTDLFPQGFTADWLSAINTRLGETKMIRDDEHNAHRSTSKAWVARELGIHAITYEFGDETDRDQIDRIANESAVAMMRLLLARLGGG